MNTRVESVCIFGSVARRSADQLSDRDILVVSSDGYRRKELDDYWTNLGWSVASYSPRRLLNMVDAGSLFIQHLKLEGQILKDRNKWLQQALQCWRSRRDFLADARQSASLAAPIERFIPEVSIRDELIASDLAYVALRNFGICYLASQNRMIFDYHEIIVKLAIEFDLSKREVMLAHSLRIGKSAYRGFRETAEIAGTIGELRLLLSKFFVQRPLKQIPRLVPVRNLGSGYAALRDLEAILVAELRKDGANQGSLSIQRTKILDWIRSPRSYAWNICNLSADDLEYLRMNLEAAGA